MKLVYLLFSLVNGYNLNIPVNVYKSNYNSQIIKVYEPKNLEKKNMNALIFYTGANSLIPGDIYSNFIRTLNNYNFSVSVVTNNNDATSEFLYDVRDDYKEIIPLTHSSGFVNAFKTINKQKNIKKAIFLDPVDNSILFDNNIFNFFNKDENSFNHLESLLVLNAEKSYEGSIFPKFQIPYIPAFALNIKNLKKNNPDLEVEKLDAKNYGHSDVLDTLWSDLMHVTLSKGNDNRDQEVLNEYLNWLAEEITNFIYKNEEDDVGETNNSIMLYEDVGVLTSDSEE
jgi:hypothetical protein